MSPLKLAELRQLPPLSTWSDGGRGYLDQEGHRFLWVGYTDDNRETYLFEAVEQPGYCVSGTWSHPGHITTTSTR